MKMKLTVIFSLLKLYFLGICHGFNITIGYLPTLSSYSEKGMQGLIASGAISYAVKTINDDPLLLPNHKLNLIWKEVNGEEMNGAQTLANLLLSEAMAFFGPESSCSNPAIVAGAFNLPIISHRCSEYTLSDKSQYPTFIRTIPTDMSLAKALISLLKTYSWSKFSMVVESIKRSQMLSEAVKLQADRNNITIQQTLPYQAPYFAGFNDDVFQKIVEKSYKNTRIYVFVGDINALIAFLGTLHSKGLLDAGDYMVIYLDLDVYYKDDPIKYIADSLELVQNVRSSPLGDAVKSLLVVTLNPPITITKENEDFEDNVNRFLTQPPFNFPSKLKKRITVFGYYLYDAVFLYARALHEHLKDSRLPEEEAIRDGQGIINRIRNIHYKSITGHTVQINEDGDVTSKFFLLARKFHISKYSDISMLPVGEFTSEEEPVFRLFDTIEWKKGKPPSVNSLCDSDCNSSYWQEILPIVCGLVLILVIVTVLICFSCGRHCRGVYKSEVPSEIRIEDTDINKKSRSPQKSITYFFTRPFKTLLKNTSHPEQSCQKI